MRKTAPSFALLALLAAGAPALAQNAPAPVTQCEPPGGFSTFMTNFRTYAAGQGISQATLSTALDGMSLDQGTIGYDRAQRRSFQGSFEQFYARRVNAGLVRRGAGLMRQHSAVLQRIEQTYGVPPAVVVAIWGLETGFGANSGNRSVIRGLAALAYDCRRPGLFQRELLAALQIVQRGDLTPATMVGAGHGEIGQTQFLPSSYMRFAVDFDGNGRRDLIRSVPDVLASTANFLRGHGWQRGAGWGEGQPNFRVLQEWNRATVYQRTIAQFATRLQEAQTAGR
jgi:lytic murein transglycosylase